MDLFEAEKLAIALSASRDYRVLRKLKIRKFYTRPIANNARIGLIVNIETTGPNPNLDEIIELGMLRFAFSPNGTILGPLAELYSVREPKKPIPKQISHLTGIVDEFVRNKQIDKTEVAEFAASADLIITHNAEFDRPFCERLCGIFQSKAWSCSRTQLAWKDEGAGETELKYIAYEQAFWFEHHYALDHCYALIEILEMPLPKTQKIAMAKLIEVSDIETRYIWALGAPCELGEHLRERGYRGNAFADGRPRAWYREVEVEKVEAELQFIKSLKISMATPIVSSTDKFIRFSDRLF